MMQLRQTRHQLNTPQKLNTSVASADVFQTGSPCITCLTDTLDSFNLSEPNETSSTTNELQSQVAALTSRAEFEINTLFTQVEANKRQINEQGGNGKQKKLKTFRQPRCKGHKGVKFDCEKIYNANLDSIFDMQYGLLYQMKPKMKVFFFLKMRSTSIL